MIKQLITNENNAKSFKDHILNCWIKSTADKIREQDFKNIKNFDNIVKRLFSVQNPLIVKVMEELFYNTSDYSDVTFSYALENYIQIILEFLKNISRYDRKLLFQRDKFFDKICEYFLAFTNKE